VQVVCRVSPLPSAARSLQSADGLAELVNITVIFVIFIVAVVIEPS
jgi:hypothetical protein